MSNQIHSSPTPVNEEQFKRLFGTVLGTRGVCTYCGKQGNTSRDHFYPKSKGGKTMVSCCRSCNQYKADLLPSQWLERVANSSKYTDDEKTRIIQSTHILLSLIPPESDAQPGPLPKDPHAKDYTLNDFLNKENPLANVCFDCGLIRTEALINTYRMVRYWKDGKYLGSKNICNCEHCKGN